MKRHLAWLGGLLVVLLFIYVSSSWLIATYIKNHLAESGFTDIALQAGYPGWNQISLTAISFDLTGITQKTRVTVPEVEIDYTLHQLIAGRISQIRAREVMVTTKAMPAEVEAASSAGIELPLAGLISGQWIDELPVDELLIDSLIADVSGYTPHNYNANIRISLKNSLLHAEGRVAGDTFQPFYLRLAAESTGKSNISIAHSDKDVLPILEWDVNANRHSNETIALNGRCDARLDKVTTLLSPWLAATPWAKSVQGNLQCTWEAELPAKWSSAQTEWQGRADVIINNLSTQWRGQTLPQSTVTAKLTADMQRVTADATVITNDKAVQLTGQGDYEFATGKAEVRYKLSPVQFPNLSMALSPFLKDLPYPLDIKTGQISGNGRLQWRDKMRLTAMVQLGQLSGTYSNINFTDLNADLPLELDKGIKTSRPAKIWIETLDVGFPVTKMNMQFSLTPVANTQIPAAKVDSITARLLGGKASLQPFDFDISRERNAFTVVLDHISLSELVALEQQEGLTATGLLDGRIPVELSGKEITVTDGTLTAREPGGVIQYSPTPGVAAMAESNPGVGLMVKALTDFQYHLLTVNADYKPGGDLLLKVRLEGKNPGWQGGRPVNLNLNLQENIPALLRSLQLSDEISDRVRKHYQKSP